MFPPAGRYRYEYRRHNRPAAIETDLLTAERLTGERIEAEGANRHEVEAELDRDSLIVRVRLRYTRGLFSRSASYEAAGDLLTGSISAMAGRNAVETKLGRFREVDGDLLSFKALIICHIRQSGRARFTGRVAIIDPATLVAASVKQTYQRLDSDGLKWQFEPAIGEREQIELDTDGRIVRRIDSRGDETALVAFEPAD
ncbi:MAG TPA: hypothetical protein VMB26_09370 [Candidatus Binataceae bacterium]|nr:hypothetical protein [Candidatus Binataceae bacterium]